MIEGSISRIEKSLRLIFKILTDEGDLIPILSAVGKIIRSFVGPKRVMEALFIPQAIWVGPVSFPIVRSQCPMKLTSSRSDIFGAMNAFVEFAAIHWASWYSASQI